MDKYIDSRFERVEKALATLIDSISKYNPSSAQANDLATADEELGAALEELQTHQNNYQRILDLRAATTALDQQIKATLSTLAHTRKDITSTTATSYPDSRENDISYDELLSYARRISRTTMPPPGVTNGVDMSPAGQRAGTTTGGIGDTTHPGSANDTAGQTPASTAGINGAHTPQPGTEPSSQQPTSAPTPAAGAPATAPTPASRAAQSPVAAGAAGSSNPLGLSSTAAAAALPEALLSRITAAPHGGVFHPWPGEAGLRSGALALLQQLAEGGVDAREHDPVAVEEAARQQREAAEEEQRRRGVEAEEERARRAAREGRAVDGAGAEGWRRTSAVGAGGGSAAAAEAGGSAKQFQFMGSLDDDDEDEDD